MIKNGLGIFFAILLSFTNYHAQSSFRIGGSFDVAIPTGDFSDITKTGVGGTLHADYLISDAFALSFSSSYLSIPIDLPPIGIDGKAIDFSGVSYNVLFGGKYFFNSSFFTIAQAGVAFWKLKLNYFNSPTNDVDNISTDYDSYFSALIGGGYKYNLAKNKSDLEVAVSYILTNGEDINYNMIIISAGLHIYL